MPVILIVDDHPSSVRILSEAVHGLGATHFSTESARAFQLAIQVEPDIVLLDIEMPGMDGYELCKLLKANDKTRSCSVIFVTSHNTEAVELRALAAGGIDFLHKPLNVPVVRARVKNHLVLRENTLALLNTQERLEMLVHNVPAFIGHWNGQLENLFCNDTKGAWFRTRAEAMQGKSLQEVIGKTLFCQFEPYVARVLRGETCTFDICVSLDGCDPRWAQATLAPWKGGSNQGLLMLLTDITARRKAETALHEEKERFRVTLNSIGDAVVATDTHGNVTFINPIAEALTGWQLSEAIGRPISKLMPLYEGETQYELRNPIFLALEEQRVVAMALNSRLKRRDGRLFDIEDSAAPILDHEGKITGAIIVFHDVSEARAMALKMNYLAQHDPLTNLPNRMLLLDRTAQALEQATYSSERTALVLLDIDDFKLINDAVGHTTGDEILKDMAHRLKGSIRSIDTLSRQGGDEFIIVLPEIRSVAMVSDFIEKIIASVTIPYWVEGRRYDLSVSVGVGVYPDDSSTADDLYRHAESAMYQAKKSGRNRFCYFSHEIEQRMQQRHLIGAQLRGAIETREIEVYYQPQIDASKKSVIGMEALVRWRNTNGQLISPVDFIPIAEETGLIIPLGKSILRQACLDALALIEQGHPTRVSVNISVKQFQDPAFFSYVQEVLKQTRLPAKMLELELTESALVQDTSQAQALLASLKSLGVSIAIDDFGTGYSSLSYLKQFPLDVLKIDQSFVREMLISPRDTAIIETIIRLAHSLQLLLIAEGVETQLQMQKLQALGCHSMQGYLFCRPVPFSQLSDFLLKKPLFSEKLASPCQK